MPGGEKACFLADSRIFQPLFAAANERKTP
jgi:hypothetical protein